MHYHVLSCLSWLKTTSSSRKKRCIVSITGIYSMIYHPYLNTLPLFTKVRKNSLLHIDEFSNTKLRASTPTPFLEGGGASHFAHLPFNPPLKFYQLNRCVDLCTVVMFRLKILVCLWSMVRKFV